MLHTKLIIHNLHWIKQKPHTSFNQYVLRIGNKDNWCLHIPLTSHSNPKTIIIQLCLLLTYCFGQSIVCLVLRWSQNRKDIYVLHNSILWIFLKMAFRLIRQRREQRRTTKLDEIFQERDKNNSGKISFAELADIFRVYHVKL